MSADNQAGNKSLTTAELFGGGDTPYKTLEIPEITVQGKIGVVYLKYPSAGDILDFSAKNAGLAQDQQNEELLKMISKCVVSEDGRPLFESGAKVRELPFPIFNRMMDAVNGLSGAGKKDEAGKDSSGTPGTDLPSN